jgi:RTX calcium-binding nonapeptide repeat (4 copies)
VLSAGGRGERVTAAAIAALALAYPFSAPGTAAAASVAARVEANPAAVRAYWTPARMRAARPAADRLSGAPRRGSAATADADPTYVPPTEPGQAARPSLPRPGLVDSRPARRAATDVSADSGTFPRRVHGKVFLTLGGIDYFCSATVVASASHTVVFTAGHCLNGADVGVGFATNWLFVPGYREGVAPFGTWTATTLLTTDGWNDHANLRLDLGAAILARDTEGRGIEDVVGARGIAFDQARAQVFEAYGYPAVDTNTPLLPPNFDGERLYRCQSPRTAADRPPGSGPETSEIECDMTAGASGGGWVIDNEFVNSVTSYGYAFDPNHLYGPYFGPAAKALYRRASGPPLRCAARAVTNLGGPGRDDFSGDGGPNTFRLERGGDEARGGGAADAACGGGGDDALRGGPGRDRLRGQAGGDLLVGGPGRDICVGGAGHDAARSCEVRRQIP